MFSRLPKVVQGALRSQRMLASTYEAPAKIAPFVQEFLPKQSTFELCKKLTEKEKADFFSLENPHKTEMLEKMEYFIMQLQKRIVGHLEDVEATAASAMSVCPESISVNNIPQPVDTTAKKFNIERSLRDKANGMGGGGVVAVLQEGRVFEKAGVNTSVIYGQMPVTQLHNMRADHSRLKDVLEQMKDSLPKTCPFAVAGISLVLHPHNPNSPTVHANYRMFQLQLGTESIWWFGGGSDLTPTYTAPNDDLAVHFHRLLKHNCETSEANFPHLRLGDEKLYPSLKKWCDTYFYLPHRNETRGVGGIFYDDLDTAATGLSQEELFHVISNFGDHFPATYFPLVRATADSPYTEEQKRFQQLRRGRYVEFNVMIDRGTKFGLEMPRQANVRTEQILMSLPLTARYEYMYTPEPNSPEAITQDILQNPINWV